MKAWSPSGLLFALIGLASALPVLAGELPFALSESQHFYPVDATTIEALRVQVDANRPQSRSGRPSHGLLKVDLTLRYELQPDGPLCRLREARVSVDLQLWLPRWRPQWEPGQALRTAWEETLAGLVEHEAGHRDRVLVSATELVERVASLGKAAADCGSLRREVMGIRLAALSRLALRNAAYDRRTGHGESQGAVLALDERDPRRCKRGESLQRRDCMPPSR